MKNIILASGSEGRKELFTKYFGDKFSIVLSHAEEKDLEYLPPKEMVLALSKRKAETVAKLYPNDFICAFDTVVECDQKNLGKPSSIEESQKMLTFLSGREQIVWSGYTLMYQNHTISGTESAVLLLDMNEEEIKKYILEHDTTKFAGGYAIQKNDANIIIKSGSMDTIIGAPMTPVLEFINAYNQ